MYTPSEHRACIPRCELPVPTELDSVGLCVHHFTWSVEEACAEMHRQVALRKATVERRAEMAIYVRECALLLARVTSNLCLSDDLKRRILCTFLSLMNLRENLERAPGGHAPELRVFAPGLFPTPAVSPIGSTRNRMPAYVVKCEGCGRVGSFLIHEGQPPETRKKQPIQRHFLIGPDQHPA